MLTCSNRFIYSINHAGMLIQAYFFNLSCRHAWTSFFNLSLNMPNICRYALTGLFLEPLIQTYSDRFKYSTKHADILIYRFISLKDHADMLWHAWILALFTYSWYLFSFTSMNWSVRNAGLQLFGALCPRNEMRTRFIIN